MKWLVTTASALGHVAAILGLDSLPNTIHPEPPTTVTMVEIPELQEPEAAPPPPVPEQQKPPPPIVSPSRAELAVAQPLPAAPPTAAPPSLDSLPNLGLELSGSSSGSGLAVSSASARGSAPQPSRPRILGAAVEPARSQPRVECKEGPSPKPQLTSFRKPAFTEGARSAGVSGKIRVSITVGADGRVEQVKVLESLGHGLDEATVAAVRSASFEPARRCGKAERSTFTMSVRFSAE